MAEGKFKDAFTNNEKGRNNNINLMIHLEMNHLFWRYREEQMFGKCYIYIRSQIKVKFY